MVLLGIITWASVFSFGVLVLVSPFQVWLIEVFKCVGNGVIFMPRNTSHLNFTYYRSSSLFLLLNFTYTSLPSFLSEFDFHPFENFDFLL